jgi:hypothetical protein
VGHAGGVKVDRVVAAQALAVDDLVAAGIAEEVICVLRGLGLYCAKADGGECCEPHFGGLFVVAGITITENECWRRERADVSVGRLPFIYLYYFYLDCCGWKILQLIQWGSSLCR